MLGEITPRMACAVGESRAEKVLIPVQKLPRHHRGGAELPVARYIEEAQGSSGR
jgi:hypothetical protein